MAGRLVSIGGRSGPTLESCRRSDWRVGLLLMSCGAIWPPGTEGANQVEGVLAGATESLLVASNERTDGDQGNNLGLALPERWPKAAWPGRIGRAHV